MPPIAGHKDWRLVAGVSRLEKRPLLGQRQRDRVDVIALDGIDAVIEANDAPNVRTSSADAARGRLTPCGRRQPESRPPTA